MPGDILSDPIQGAALDSVVASIKSAFSVTGEPSSTADLGDVQQCLAFKFKASVVARESQNLPALSL